MSVYPYAIDDDSSIVRIDDNLDELGTRAINQLRDAVFAIEKELGIGPSGSASTVASRLNKSLDADGDIKSSALSSIGLATLPIHNNQVASNAGIIESKLTLDYSTTDLYTRIVALEGNFTSLSDLATTTNADLLLHIAGNTYLSDASTQARHVGSQIDLNSVPSDTRDPTYNWTGLVDKDGTARTATEVNTALYQINEALTTHENLTEDAHPATAITVDTGDFTEIPLSANTAQKVFDAIDDTDRLQIGIHRATMHDNAVPRTARTTIPNTTDGYSEAIVSVTPVNAYLTKSPATSPVDNNNLGDDLVIFQTTAGNYEFDAQFSAVRPGDYITVNYGNGIESQYKVKSTRFIPGSSWIVRLDNINISSTGDGYDGYARIDRALFDDRTQGVFAVGTANNDIDSNIPGSLIVGNPRSAMAFGLGFEPGQLDTTHYKLYLNLYPSGDPSEKTLTLPGIDVTGNSGTTPGAYTLDTVVQVTNNSLRAAGYNHRFVAFAHNGEFGIMMADPHDNASFSIVTGEMSSGSLTVGVFTNNVIGDATDNIDALGFGATKSALGSPNYRTVYDSAADAANFPTKVIRPLAGRNAIINGVRRDTFATTYGTGTDGYWIGSITDRTDDGTTVHVTYEVEQDLCPAELKVGKTITVLPTVAYTDGSYLDADYGRFVIEEVIFTDPCGGASAKTTIKVINGVHATSNPLSTTSAAGLQVRLYFGEDSVAFNNANVIDAVPAGEYMRHHETYIDEDGKTFALERARMPEQQKDAQPGYLETRNNWVITEVSPKLRGWRDDETGTDLKKYVRFYVLSYNSTTGEYDGYIGRRDPALETITQYGQVVRARKNIPTRFYDATNVDYIEVMFRQTGTTSITVLPVDNLPRFVDIELFAELSTNDEVFKLATCQIKDNVVDWVTDRREFGAVSEKNFSSSAIDFIQATGRHLHSNGVIEGLNFKEAGSGDGELIFNGGVAFVNGAVLTVNDGSIVIPEIREASDSTIDWAICINEHGIFEAVLITSSKKQFFVSNISPSYYVVSMTFAELVDTRKDLLPVAVVTATIASISLGSVTDIRKFATGDLGALTLGILSTDGQTNATFRSFESLVYWVDNYNVSEVLVKEIDLIAPETVAFTNRVGIYGGEISITNGPLTISNCDIYRTFIDISGAEGLVIDEVSIKDSDIRYRAGSLTFTTNDMINASVGYGISVGSDVLIENCKFRTDSSSPDQRPPFILGAAGSGETNENIFIRGNEFDDGSPGGAGAPDNCAICFDQEYVTGSETPAQLKNVHIEDNQCTEAQTIVIGARGAATIGRRCYGSSIKNNKCGAVGFLTSSETSGIPYFYFSGLEISGNNCYTITNVTTEYTSAGHVVIPDNDRGTGYVVIKDNVVRGSVIAYSGGTSTYYASTAINGNTIHGRVGTFINDFFNSPTLLSAVFAGSVGVSSADQNKPTAVISGNRIFLDDVGATTTTLSGITTYGNANIADNRIDLISSASFSGGVRLVRSFAPTAGGTAAVITTGNQLVRGSNTINNYIVYAAGVDGIIADNYLDGYDIDGAGTYATAITAPSDVLVERNKNHRVSEWISMAFQGLIYDSGGRPMGVPGFSITGLNSIAQKQTAAGFPGTPDECIRFFFGSSVATFATWRMDLRSVLPKNVTVIQASVRYLATAATYTTGTITVELRKSFDDSDTSGVSSGADLTVIKSGVETTPEVAFVETSRPYITAGFSNVQDVSGAGRIDFNPVLLTYQW